VYGLQAEKKHGWDTYLGDSLPKLSVEGRMFVKMILGKNRTNMVIDAAMLVKGLATFMNE